MSSSSNARNFTETLINSLQSHGVEAAYPLLDEILKEGTPFRLLDIIGAGIGKIPSVQTDHFLQRIARQKREGGWVVIASALRENLDDSLPCTLEKCRGFIVQANIWYGCDTFGERVIGPALLSQFDRSLDILQPWREDPNRWVRRAVGVGGHFWAKRKKGAPTSFTECAELLDFFISMLADRDLDAAKGIGWALKTLGRYYPAMVRDLLVFLIHDRGQRIHPVIKRKTTKFLPMEMKQELQGK